MARGGKRDGAGRKKGAQTLEKEAMRTLVRERVGAQLLPLVDAQIANAIGIKYLVVRQKSTGKFVRVGEVRANDHDADLETIEVWEKDPSVQAFTDLLNRTIDKPVEPAQVVEHRGAITLQWADQ